MTVRQTMTYRAVIERNTVAGSTQWNQKPTPDWTTHLAACPCRVWYADGREVADGGKVVSVDQLKMIVPLGTDVTPADRLGDVSDRLGNVLFAGPVRIASVRRRRDHLAVKLEVV